ncbi:MAG: HAD family phosphatase [Gemmatimonadaceae bacterium]|nr:HAD family phosphatase [Gemmatimonadaceae bacterium]
MEVPVLLIEFEGVLVETMSARRVALTESLAVEGIVATDAILAQAAGYPTEEAVRRARRAAGAPDDETAVELGRLRAERTFAIRVGKGLPLTPGVRAAVERLATHARVALVTRATRREVEFLLGLADLDGLFRPIVACEDVQPAKPAREPWLAALARVGQLFPGQQLRALAVEDHVVGLRGARAAGLASVGVGAIPPHEAIEGDAWVETLADLTPERVRALLGTGSERRR